jgi:hypothetical protein
MPLYRQVIPQEAGIGWPLPRRKKEDGRVYVTVPVFGMRPLTGGGAELYPIFATVTVDWGTKTVVEYVDLRYAGLCPKSDDPRPVGRFPHNEIAGMTVAEYRAAKGTLLALYDTLFDTLGANGEFDAGFSAEFAALFGRLLEPGLESQYRALAEKFVARFKPEARHP